MTVLTAIAGTLLALTAACSGSKAATVRIGASVKDPGDAKVTITPVDGTTKVRPDKGVTVTADNGTVDQVSVQPAGDAPADGELSADKKTWHTRWGLKPGASYTVTAVAKNPKGRPTTVTSKFTTLPASSTFSVSDVTPGNGETVGVGMPIIVDFDSAISDRAAVEKSLELKMSTPVEGAWYWVGDQQVVFRAKNYWAPHSSVTLVAHTTGARAASGVYGTSNFKRSFKVGESHITRVKIDKHRLSVAIDGKVAKPNVPISAGMGSGLFETASGNYLAMARFRVTEMTSSWMGVDPKDTAHGGYDEMIPWATQIDNSGDFIHESPGELGCLGNENCSHGCIRSPSAFAQWYYGIFQPGDVVIVTGTGRELAWDNGWSYYQMPWSKWVNGSALKAPVNPGASADSAPTASGSPAVAPSPSGSRPGGGSPAVVPSPSGS